MTFNHDSADQPFDLPSITSPDDMLTLAANDQLKLEQIKALVAIHPGMVQAAIESMQSLTKISEAASNAQVEAIKNLRESISGSLEVLKILAQQAQSDTTRERIAERLLELAKQNKELCQMSKDMKHSNNTLWMKIATGVGLLVVGGVAVAATLRNN